MKVGVGSGSPSGRTQDSVRSLSHRTAHFCAARSTRNQGSCPASARRSMPGGCARCSRSTPSASRARPRTSRAGSGSTRSSAFCEPSGLPLAGRLRPGRASAMDGGAQHHLLVIDDAIAALPEGWQQGHRAGDDAGLVERQLLVRVDTAGYSHKVIGGLAARNCLFSIGMPANDRFDGEIHQLRYDQWRPALAADGTVRRGAQVAEIAVAPDCMPEPLGDRAPGTTPPWCTAQAVGPQRLAPPGRRDQPGR